MAIIELMDRDVQAKKVDIKKKPEVAEKAAPEEKNTKKIKEKK